MNPSTHIHPPRLYAITDSRLMPLSQFNYKAEQALQAGVEWIQYRDKSNDTCKRLYQALALKALCDQYNAKLIINDDIELALNTGAHGVHLGQSDGDIRIARRTLGKHAIIGSTCHDQIALAEHAKEQGADYIAFGRFFSSRTKPYSKPAPLTLVGRARAINLPIVTIGGITTFNANKLIKAGADSLAVCHTIFGTNNIQRQVRLLSNIAKQPR